MMTFANAPVDEGWRIDMLLNLLSVKFDNWYVNNFDFDDINAMICFGRRSLFGVFFGVFSLSTPSRLMMMMK